MDNIKININFSASDEEVEIFGSSCEMLSFKNIITEFERDGNQYAEFKISNNCDRSAYPTKIEYVNFILSIENNTFKVVDNTFIISGNSDFISNFICNIPTEYDSNSNVSYHVHYDRVSFGKLLSSESLDLVMAVS